jgi:hypothetical protein
MGTGWYGLRKNDVITGPQRFEAKLIGCAREAAQVFDVEEVR